MYKWTYETMSMYKWGEEVMFQGKKWYVVRVKEGEVYNLKRGEFENYFNVSGKELTRIKEKCQ